MNDKFNLDSWLSIHRRISMQLTSSRCCRRHRSYRRQSRRNHHRRRHHQNRLHRRNLPSHHRGCRQAYCRLKTTRTATTAAAATNYLATATPAIAKNEYQHDNHYKNYDTKTTPRFFCLTRVLAWVGFVLALRIFNNIVGCLIQTGIVIASPESRLYIFLNNFIGNSIRQ